MKISSLAFTFSVLVAGVASVACEEPAKAPTASSASGDALGRVLAGSQRSAENRARDGARHPKETLAFFGLKDTMSVVEISPGGGWYTEILSPYLADRGALSVTSSKNVADRIHGEPKLFGKVKLLGENNFGPDGSADLVLTFRNIHNWLEGDRVNVIFGQAFRVLKSGGILGVVEHRAKPGTSLKISEDTGYVSEEEVIGFATKTGFSLDAKSEINANPKDDTNHLGGVWALPPSFENENVEREKYASIGESDRMTLRFKKP